MNAPRFSGHRPKVTDGSTVSGGNDGWSAYSECPSGYVAIAPATLKLAKSGNGTNVNDFECTMVGCRVWLRGSTATLQTRCLKISRDNVKDSSSVEAPANAWSAYATCPSGYTAVGPSFIDLHDHGPHSDVNHYECTTAGCRVLITGGTATLITRCIHGTIVDADKITTSKDSWSSYSTCPCNAVALGLSYIDLLNGQNVHHQECTSTACRAWIEGGNAHIATRCISSTKTPSEESDHR